MKYLSKSKPNWLHIIASAVVPGLGQLIKGHMAKAATFAVAFFGLAALFSWFPLFWAVSGLIWVVNVLDAALSEDA